MVRLRSAAVSSARPVVAPGRRRGRSSRPDGKMRRWPGDETIGHLVLIDHGAVPSSLDIDQWIEQATASGLRAVRTGAMFPRVAEVFADAGFVPIDTLALSRARPARRSATPDQARDEASDTSSDTGCGHDRSPGVRSTVGERRDEPDGNPPSDAHLPCAPTECRGSDRRVRDQRRRRFDWLPATPRGRPPPSATGSRRVARRGRAVLDARSSPRERARQHRDRQCGSLALYDQFGFRQRADRLTIAELDLTRRG